MGNWWEIICTGYCDVDRLSIKASTIRTEEWCVALQLCRQIIFSIVFHEAFDKPVSRQHVSKKQNVFCNFERNAVI